MLSEKKFIFYDTETSGLNTMFGQIFQFAAILTDENFQIIDQFEIRSRRMPHIVPDPGAMLVTGVTPDQLEKVPDSYYSFATKIRETLLRWSPAIFCGYNIYRFDEHFMRSMYYQNLYPPYLSQTNGNKRLDVLPLVRAAEQLFPGSLHLPLNEKGKTSKKLEDVALANGFKNHNAHDAMGDVLATIHLVERIQDRVPFLWGSALDACSRADFNRSIEGENWFVVHDHNNGWPVTFPAVEISKTDNGRNSLLYDLRYPLEQVEGNPLEDNFKGRQRPFRVAKSAETPLVFKRDDLDQLDMTHSLDFERLDELALEAKQNASIYKIASLRDEMRQEFEKSSHIEAQIYDDFDAFDRDKYLMEEFHLAMTEEKLGIVRQMSDERFRSFARRIIYENFPEQMSRDEIEEFQKKIHDRVNECGNVPWTTLYRAISECNNLVSTAGEKNATVSRIKKYLQQLSTQ